ncbi:ADP-L-glycero-D-manno-heptose-6-epimerase [Anaerobiospirillum thomasii]|nr:ADP-L-glycero-D-manno-heptose-6-epimerase [Anaerobiospirillum thomasii]
MRAPCSATTEWDGQYVMRNNYEYTVTLFEFAVSLRFHFYMHHLQPHTAAGSVFVENRVNEAPLNVYGYSKFLFDDMCAQDYHISILRL